MRLYYNLIFFLVFVFGTQAQVRFNEAIFDPVPNRGLAITSEFIELYNYSLKAVNLSGFKMSDRHNAIVLPDVIVPANTYIVLVPTAKKQAEIDAIKSLQSTIHIVELQKWVSLNNDEETLSLFDADDTLIDRLDFVRDDYESSDFKDGGISLEKVDLTNLCETIDSKKLWRPSLSDIGGTLGIENSKDQKPDNYYLLYTKVDNVLQLSVKDEKIWQFGLLLFSQITTSGDVAPSFSPKWDIVDGMIEIDARSANILGKAYHIVVKNIQICNGQTINQLKADVVVPLLASEKRQIILSEIMFDPEINQPEYLELYNTTGQYLALGNLVIVRTNNEIAVPYRLENDHYNAIPPYTALVWTNDGERLAEQFVDLLPDDIIEDSGFISLVNSGARLTLKTQEDILIDEIDYSPSDQSDFLTETKGIALIRRREPSQGWYSADPQMKGTPGRHNDASQENETPIAVLKIEPRYWDLTASPTQELTVSYPFAKEEREDDHLLNLTLLDKNGVVIKHLVKEQKITPESRFFLSPRLANGLFLKSGRYILIAQIKNVLTKKSRIVRNTFVLYQNLN